MQTKPRQFRLDDETLRKLDELAALFGGEVKPHSRTAVIKYAIEAMHYTRMPSGRIPKPKTGQKKS